MSRHGKLRFATTVLVLVIFAIIMYVRYRTRASEDGTFLRIESISWDAKSEEFVVEAVVRDVLARAILQDRLKARVLIQLHGVRVGPGKYGTVEAGPATWPVGIQAGREPPRNSWVWLDPLRVPWDPDGVSVSREGALTGIIELIDRAGIVQGEPWEIHLDEVDLAEMLGL
jgi:hypothetical protein